MFFHKQELQHDATPDKPDPIYARHLQEVLGGQYGEISVAMQYGFQSWNSKLPGKYRDMLYGIGAEEFGHVEMLAIMIAKLLETAPVEATEEAMKDPTLAAVIGGMDIQHAIVAGAGARPVDSNGNPWQGSFITCSGNLLADFTANANAEMQGRIQAARLYHMTDDHGVKDLLSFLIARDTMHQNQWTAAIAELRAEGTEDLPVPSDFPIELEDREVSYQYLNFSNGPAAAEGSWASGPTPDGKGTFTYHDGPTTTAPMPAPPVGNPLLHGTIPPKDPGILKKAAGAVKDAVTPE
ncbi:manganese catalase family protein [Clavibacter zhangzhiyongii]|jgi:Mn-containing catalase|uniref:manganese catalase family protein n=1 Tax=Clavibacter zhangzhiyongii TaxID=2768071 RepID=UPI00195B5C63|nr:manganese catalase family protein [Clavibacter zhangzhiyongii]MBM7026213.1 manganese catalase family protein [Clavibacter zhangzhiyongii]